MPSSGFHWKHGFRAHVPCPVWLAGCQELFGKALPIPIISLALPGQKVRVYRQKDEAGADTPHHRLVGNTDYTECHFWAQEFAISHVDVDGCRRRVIVSAKIKLSDSQSLWWINVWVGTTLPAYVQSSVRLLGILYCTLSLDTQQWCYWTYGVQGRAIPAQPQSYDHRGALYALPDYDYVCMCGYCEPEWLDRGWMCKLVHFASSWPDY